MASDDKWEELRQLIEQLPPKDAAWVAARAAMRVLPLLVEVAPKAAKLEWWPLSGGKKEKGLPADRFLQLVFASFRACQCAAVYDAAATSVSVNPLAFVDAFTDIPIFPTFNDAYASAAFADASVVSAANSSQALALADASTALADSDTIDATEDTARIIRANANAVRAATNAVRAASNAVPIATASSDQQFFIIQEDIILLTRQSGRREFSLWPATMPVEFASSWQILQSVLLGLDPGFQYWIDWYEARLRGDPIVWEDIRDQILLTKEQLQQEPATINAYLLSLARKTAVLPLNRVRAIFIGPGGAGKTSLLRALHVEPVVKGTEDKTVGIEIRESCFDVSNNKYQPAAANSRDIVTYFWDFGGQVMYHATHQFFLRSNCVYVLVLDGRQTRAGGTEADYWLEHVRAFAPDAPVLLVGNKADLGPMDWDENRLRKKYPNIRPHGFYHLACTDTQGRYRHDFERFKQNLREALEQAGTVQQKFTNAEFALLEELRRRSPKETFLPKSDYETLCTRRGLTAERPATLLDLLDKLGVIIHFPDLRWDAEDYLLNPRWLTYGVYQLIERQLPNVNEQQAFDCLSKAKVTDNLGNPLTYPKDRCGFILKAIEQFKVAYRLPSSGAMAEYRIPSLLPTKEPMFEFPEAQARAFRFRFEGLLPPQLLPQLIVERHADIVDNLVWRHGVVLTTHNPGVTLALLRGDDYDRSLTLWITGKGLEHYFGVLYDKVKAILKTMPELPCEELIRLPTWARLDHEPGVSGLAEPWARWNNVLHASLEGDMFYREGGVKYDLQKVLGIMAESQRKKWADGSGRSWHIHHHYSERNMGNTFINNGQAGAIGDNSKAEGNTFQQVALHSTELDFPKLAAELARLLEAMKGQASSVEHYQALAQVAAAEESAKQKDGPKLLGHLKAAGSRALDVATKIGVSVATKVIEQQMGL